MEQIADSNSLNQEFIELDRGWVAAYLQGSAELFDRIWKEGFVFTFPFGEFNNQAKELSNIGSGTIAFEHISSDNLTVRVYGTTAVMAGNFILKGHYEDRDISGRYSYTNVVERQHDELWHIVASQANLIA
jgi:hypothetical protein